MPGVPSPANGTANGHANGAANGHASADSVRERKNAAAKDANDQNALANGNGVSDSQKLLSEAPTPVWVKKPVKPKTGITAYPPISWAIFLFELFFSPRFFVHRVVGLMYLIQWVLAFVLYFADYEKFAKSPLTWSIPLTGLMQAITAAYTFTFLPKKTADTGYFSDLKAMSYTFVVENSFFASILLFQWLYINDPIYWSFFRPTVIPEFAFVFLPYTFRELWPKTSFRDSFGNQNKSDKNKMFYNVGLTITKSFYIWAKHFIGFFLNYVRFLDRMTPEEVTHIYLLEMFSGFATTIGMFLHTLKFKKYMGPRLSFFIYAGSYLMTFYTYIRIYDIFLKNPDLVLITIGGVLINFRGRTLQYGYQVLVLSWFAANRYAPELLPEWAILRQGQKIVS